MDRVAFVIPIHPPFFHYLRNFLAQMPPASSRVYAVFSSPEDRDAFGEHPALSPIVIPQGLTYDSGSSAGIVDYKKFYALHQLKDSHHDYFIVCDSEIQLVPENFTPENVLGKIEAIFRNKQIYASNGGSGNTVAACNVFGPDDAARAKVLTQDYGLVFWWSDLPVWKREHLPHFFEVLPIPDTIYSRPDYNIYQIYLALYHDFAFLNLSPHIGVYSSLEGFATRKEELIDRLTALGYGHAWVMVTQLSLNRDKLMKLGTFLAYHLDRYTTPDWWDGQ